MARPQRWREWAPLPLALSEPVAHYIERRDVVAEAAVTAEHFGVLVPVVDHVEADLPTHDAVGPRVDRRRAPIWGRICNGDARVMT